MVGAVTWGALSDIMGRTFPFNATLLLTSIFGLLASFVSHKFWLLCFWLFWLGTAGENCNREIKEDYRLNDMLLSWRINAHRWNLVPRYGTLGRCRH